jgi:ATP-dependent DNA helicase RecG
MYLRELKTPVINIKGVGASGESLFAKKGIYSVADLLYFEPRDYEDRSEIVPLRDYYKKKVCTVATVLEHKKFFFNKAPRWKIVIEDDTMRGELAFYGAFNLCDKLIIGERY